MEIHIESNLVPQSFDFFACAPGSPKEPIDVRSKHGTSMVQRKHGIKPLVPKFTLPRDRTPTSGDPDVLSIW